MNKNNPRRFQVRLITALPPPPKKKKKQQQQLIKLCAVNMQCISYLLLSYTVVLYDKS